MSLAPYRRARLFYDDTCPPCRKLSRLAVVLALGTVRRVPLGSAEAARLHADHPQWAGQLLLLRPTRRGDRAHLGLRVFAALPFHVLLDIPRLLWQAFLHLSPRRSRRSKS
jgi:hypothetical protein